MRGWLSRNAVPIILVGVAAALVIGAFELIDVFADSTSEVAQVEGDGALSGIASLAGLIKVTLFLAVGALVAIPARRQVRAASAELPT